MDVPWSAMSDTQRAWVLEGEGEWEDGKWYGARRFFDWLETKSYRMHIRVLLSKYRAYRLCPACGGARLKPEALLWRLGAGAGLNIHEVMLLPIDRCLEFFRELYRLDEGLFRRRSGELLELTRLPYAKLHPYRAQVSRGLLAPLDDRKRLVRQTAVRVRNEWMVMDR